MKTESTASLHCVEAIVEEPCTSPQVKVWNQGTSPQWFASYLSNRSQHVSFDQKLSEKLDLSCGVPQGSCLGPPLFKIYVSKLFEIIEGYLPQTHAYADDTQLYVSFLG